MRLKVLGAYGASDATHNLTGYLIDDRIAVDAGTLTSKLSLAQQSRIEAVFITHAHADHIRDLPHLIHNRFAQETAPLVVIASKQVMSELMEYVFNGKVWPDFSTLPVPATGKPPVIYRELQPGKKTLIAGVSFTAVAVDHSVPAAGAIIEIAGQTIVFTGDTGPTTEIWKRTNKITGVVTVITEASFPNEMQQIASDSGHMTPDTLGRELPKITADIPVYASHRKLPYERSIESEMKNIRDRRARILVEKQYTF